MMTESLEVRKLKSSEQQLTLVGSPKSKESDVMFKNTEERLAYIENPSNWKLVYESHKFKTRISVLSLKHLKYLRTEVFVSANSWYKNGEDHWMDASTRKILDNGVQSNSTYTANQIAEDFKAERDKL